MILIYTVVATFRISNKNEQILLISDELYNKVESERNVSRRLQLM
jgi:hypothetical protein